MYHISHITFHISHVIYKMSYINIITYRKKITYITYITYLTHITRITHIIVHIMQSNSAGGRPYMPRLRMKLMLH